MSTITQYLRRMIFGIASQGTKNFLSKLIQAIAETLNEVNNSEIIESVIQELAGKEEIQALSALANK